MNTNTQNVDYTEIRKFEELASRWWDPNSEFKALHDINPLRLEYINQHAPLNNCQVLDVGCGGGILSEAMAHKGATVTGIDMGDAPLNVARLHKYESDVDIDYQQTTAEEFADKYPAKFDTVTCLEMLEHVPDPASVIAACAKLVKPGGNLFFSTINRNPKAWMLAIVGGEYLLRMLPIGTHDYQKFIKPSELNSWACHEDLTIQDITGMTYNPLTHIYRLDKNVDVNYLTWYCRATD